MRRLVVLSILLILAGLALLLPSSSLYSLLTKGSTSSATATVVRFGAPTASGTSDNTSTIESLVGFGLVGVGVVVELLSLFVDVGGATLDKTSSQVDIVTPAPGSQAQAPQAGSKPGEEKQ